MTTQFANIIYQHDDFYVINKPVGIGMHQEGEISGIVEIMKQQLDVEQLWLVHRLDKVTSGGLILAKSAAAASYFGELFTRRQVSKYYLALSDKKPSKKQGAVIGDMSKSRNGTFKLARSKENPAKSQFYSRGTADFRVFLLKPTTGKTHQLRVAMKSLSAPILGDAAYGGTPADRTYLHAFGLEFDYHGSLIQVHIPPSQGEHFQSKAVQQAIEEFSSPWQITFPTIPK